MREFIRKGETPVLRYVEGKGQMPYLSFPLLEGVTREDGSPLIRHMFTTRDGGVSSGIFATMSLLRGTGDTDENVDENFSRVAKVMGVGKERFVLSNQSHTTNVIVAAEENAGSGTIRDRDYEDVDGLITDIPGLALGIFLADCVPVFFVDPVHEAIGLAHSGWRGTVGKISRVTIEKMGREYGTRAEDLYCALGPSICRDCYEVSGDVAEALQGLFPEGDIVRPGRVTESGEQKYQAGLWEAIRLTLLEAGVREDRIQVTDLCTCCNPTRLFSHRYTKGKRGLLGGFLMLLPKED